MPRRATIARGDFFGLIEVSKQFLCSMMHDPPPGRLRLGQASLGARAVLLKTIIGWMAVDGVAAFRDMDEAAMHRLRVALSTRPGRDRAGQMRAGTLMRYLMLFKDLYRQRNKLRDAPTIDPFLRETITGASGFKPPDGAFMGISIPDPIAVHLLRHALKWVETHSAHIIAAESIRMRMHSGTTARTSNAALLEGRHALLAARLVDPEGRNLTSFRVTQRLVHLLIDACFIVIGGFVGMRVSEILSLRAGAVEYHGPLGANERPAYLVGTLFKMSTGVQGRPERWVAPPAAVEAVHVLEQLGEAARQRSGRTELFLSLKGNKGAAVTLPGRRWMAERMNDFANHVGVPQHNGQPWKLSPHQLRTTFARFIAKRDRTQLLGLAQHFKHVSVAMTAKHYVGSDFELRELIDRESRVETASALEHMLTSESLAGRLGERLNARGALFRGRAGEQVRKDYIKFVMQETDLRVHACDYGWCVFQAETARCEGVLEPNDALRSPSTCLSCSNMVVARQHRPYWQDRRARNAALLPAASLLTRAVLQKAIDQCDRVLNQLGADAVDEEDIHHRSVDGARVSSGARPARARRRPAPKPRRKARPHHSVRRRT